MQHTLKVAATEGDKMKVSIFHNISRDASFGLNTCGDCGDEVSEAEPRTHVGDTTLQCQNRDQADRRRMRQGHTEDTQFRAEVVARGETHWASSGLRFDTRDEALEYVEDLARRWVLVIKYRAVAVSVPERERYVNGTEDGGW
jgi:hypothetical protein